MQLVSNPSHLEAVDPGGHGAHARPAEREGEGRAARIMPIVMHGDAAFAGQGITAETLNFAGLPGYRSAARCTSSSTT